MTTTPSLRRMWTMYEERLVQDGASRRDELLAQSAFYSGARCVLQVLNHLVEGGEADELQRVISRHGHSSRVLQEKARRTRRH